MGICYECKKQTDNYCITHKKHICTECMFKSHQQCTVCKYKEYVEENREEVTTCAVCNEAFGDKEVVRLPCYCVLHKDCVIKVFDETIEELKCPRCHAVVFSKEHPLEESFKKELMTVFEGKPYIQPICDTQAAETKDEPVDEVVSVLLSNEEKQPEEVENVEYTQHEVTSLKPQTKGGVQPTEPEPTIEFDVESDEEDHGHSQKKTIGESFVESLGQKKTMSGRVIFAIMGLMILIVLFVVLVYFIGNQDT